MSLSSTSTPRKRSGFREEGRSNRERSHATEKKVNNTQRWSMGQQLTFSALCLPMAAILIALLVFCFTPSLQKVHTNQLSVRTQERRPQNTKSGSYLRRYHLVDELVQRGKIQVGAIGEPTTASPVEANMSKSTHIGGSTNIAWLMSFPNSGTSFTLHMAREASNCTTATNYALEGDIKDKPSVQAIEGPLGAQGPWLELIPGRQTLTPPTILTKTHCKGFCSGPQCKLEQSLLTARSFLIGCLSGSQAVTTNLELELIRVSYNASLVNRAIHLFRHPLDNIVARFRLALEQGKLDIVKGLSSDSNGFRSWCAAEDANNELLKSKFLDLKLRKTMRDIPCYNDFFRYAQWHNMALVVTHDLNIPTMILNYEDFEEKFDETRDRVLNFLGLPIVGKGIDFEAGKKYRSYYSADQRHSIRRFLKEFASAEMWEYLKHYEF